MPEPNELPEQPRWAPGMPEPRWLTSWVQATEAKEKPTGGHSVILWEPHDQHPGGECFLAAGLPPRLVALTPEVCYMIRAGRLRCVPEPAEVLAETPWIGKAPPAADPILPPRPVATYAVK